jgi:hypothetical protein
MTLSLSTMWAQQPPASAVRQIRRSTPTNVYLSLLRSLVTCKIAASSMQAVS